MCVTGRHTVEILYNNQAIMGSPFFVEIYDPNKVVVTGRPEGTVGVPMSIDSMYFIFDIFFKIYPYFCIMVV